MHNCIAYNFNFIFHRGDIISMLLQWGLEEIVIIRKYSTNLK